jgi:branched-chain amino acid aminotransferase
MPITSTPKIWMNGELVDWERAQVHVLTHTLHYGTGVFEGMRAYPTEAGPGIFRLTEHIERLHRSAKILLMPLTWSVAELVQASKDTVNSTGLHNCYVRPLAYYGSEGMGLHAAGLSVHVVVADVDLLQARGVKAQARAELKALGIHHATIELEWADEHCGLEHH